MSLLKFEDAPNVRWFIIFQNQDLKLAGSSFMDYEVTLVGHTGTTVLNRIESSHTFNLRVKNPCIDPDLV